MVWLDAACHYSTFVDRLLEARADGALPYQIEAFRGSFLELMAALEPVAEGVLPPKLLIHLPGFTEERVRSSPLLEIYAAGARYRKALPTLVAEAAAGQVLPEEVGALLAEEGLCFEDADRWLDLRMTTEDSELAANLRHLPSEALIPTLLRGGDLAREATENPGQSRSTLRLPRHPPRTFPGLVGEEVPPK